jgi:hypothetical protein
MPKILKRCREWINRQPSEVQALYCSHFRYVGFRRALAYRCELCPET